MQEISKRKSQEFPYDIASRKAFEAARAPAAFSEDWWGCSSIESFYSAGSLSYTHDDAGGWIGYLERFHPRNFWYQDGGCGIWYWYEDYDNWQDTYGADAVNAVYHSGHGGMDTNGVFFMPMGNNWDGQSTVYSNNMRLGNEQVNYIFLSTCESLRIYNGQSPIRTWGAANLGFRMLFGFETVSVDNPSYGSYFWDEWNRGKSFSAAWLDASWRISSHQAPSVVACGNTADEASNRVFNERLFYWDHVSHNYWWWRWYDAARSAAVTRERNRALPKEYLVAELVPVQITEESVRDVAAQYGVASKISGIDISNDTFYLKQENTLVAFGNDGSNELTFSAANISNREQLSIANAKSTAEASISKYGLDEKADLALDRVRLSYAAGGSMDGKGKRGVSEGPYVTETTVQYKQLINGLPVITPGFGEVRVAIDNDGAVTSIHSSTREVTRLSDRPKNTTSAPPEKINDGDSPSLASPKATEVTGYEGLLTAQWQKSLASWIVKGSIPLEFHPVPGTTEVGYEIRQNDAILAVRRLMEADFGSGYRKQYWVVATILE